MIAINEWTKQKCKNKEVFSVYLVLLSPFAPHITEELWNALGNEGTIINEPWPKYNDEYIKETSFEYPVSFNGKMRFKIPLSLNLNKEQIETAVLEHEKTIKHLNEKKVKKVIVVPGKIVNIVA